MKTPTQAMFHRAAAIVLDLEGGVVDHPYDPGGLTKYGVSSRSHPEVLNPDFSKDEALAMYRATYWDPMRCDELPWHLALAVFDGAVNAGADDAAPVLQIAIGGVTVDGVIGPKTIAAAQDAPMAAVDRYLAERARRMMASDNWNTFGTGWLRRLFRIARETER